MLIPLQCLIFRYFCLFNPYPGPRQFSQFGSRFTSLHFIRGLVRIRMAQEWLCSATGKCFIISFCMEKCTYSTRSLKVYWKLSSDSLKRENSIHILILRVAKMTLKLFCFPVSLNFCGKRKISQTPYFLSFVFVCAPECTECAPAWECGLCPCPVSYRHKKFQLSRAERVILIWWNRNPVT